MSRDKGSQTKHDAMVKQIANDLQKQGYNVNADIPGFKQPETIGGYRPDVVAKKPNERTIIEVETPDSVESARDLKQQQAFRNAAKRSKKTTFRRRVTK